jgi:hypothetical protein
MAGARKRIKVTAEDNIIISSKLLQQKGELNCNVTQQNITLADQLYNY